MWMMTKIGFFSIVEKPKGMMCIRARCLKDMINLEKVFPGLPEVEHTPRADYPFRVLLDKQTFRHGFQWLADGITYNNFKNEVRKTNKHREELYHQVWAILRQIETEEREEED